MESKSLSRIYKKCNKIIRYLPYPPELLFTEAGYARLRYDREDHSVLEFEVHFEYTDCFYSPQSDNETSVCYTMKKMNEDNIVFLAEAFLDNPENEVSVLFNVMAANNKNKGGDNETD